MEKTRIKSKTIEKMFGEHINYLEYEGKNGNIDDDTVITVVYKPQYKRPIERIKLKNLILRTIKYIHRI